MSWAEVYKINSDMTTPLNMLDLIEYIDMAGSNYNPTANPDIMYQLVNSPSLYSHSVAASIVCNGFWDYMLNGGESNVGTALQRVFGLTGSFGTATTYTNVLSNTNFVNALGASKKVFDSLGYVNDQTIYDGVLGSSGQLLNTTRQALFQSMAGANEANHSDKLRDGVGWTKLIANAEQFLARQTHSYTASANILTLVVGIGAGEGGANRTQVGGSGGMYVQKIVSMNSGNKLDATIAADSTVSTFANISLGAGGGANAGTAPSQKGKIIKVSQPGNLGASDIATGGGGGYGGGNGGNGYNARTSDNRGIGGTGSAVLNIVDETGGAGGSGRGSYTGTAGTGGGGGGGGASSGSICGGGGGGYGGGGGAGYGSGTTYNYETGYGGSGGIIVFH